MITNVDFIPQFRRRVLRWARKHGRCGLPWQEDRDPYRLWVAEIMLQQTQVQKVIPYYTRFIAAFPDIYRLAQCEDEVLYYWSGLGYYSRARMLYRSAQIIIQQYGGQLPQCPKKLQDLPGIGRSTAGALLASAFGKKGVILDGNVKRVLSRYHGVFGAPNQCVSLLWQYAEHYTPSRRAARYNQAMMDLGALCCTPRDPDCGHCPLRRDCFCRQNGLQQQLPEKAPPKKMPVRKAYMLIIRNTYGEILLIKRPPRGVWGSLWHFPETNENPEQYCRRTLHFTPSAIEFLPQLHHSFTHFRLEITPVYLSLPTQSFCRKIMECAPIYTAQDCIWYNLQRPHKVGMSAPVTAILKKLSQDET